jgi:hypothetical protein
MKTATSSFITLALRMKSRFAVICLMLDGRRSPMEWEDTKLASLQVSWRSKPSVNRFAM